MKNWCFWITEEDTWVPWTARRSNHSTLKEINPEYSLEELRLKLKLQYFGHLMRRTDSLGKTLRLGKIEARRRRDQQRMKWLDVSPTQGTCIWASSRSWWWTGKSGMLQSMGVAESQTQLSNWTDWLRNTTVRTQLQRASLIGGKNSLNSSLEKPEVGSTWLELSMIKAIGPL